MWIFISTPRSIQFSVNRRLIIAFTTGHMDYYMVMSLDAKRFSKVHMVQFDFCQLSVEPQMVTICLGKWLKNRQFMSWIHFSFLSRIEGVCLVESRMRGGGKSCIFQLHLIKPRLQYFWCCWSMSNFLGGRELHSMIFTIFGSTSLSIIKSPRLTDQYHQNNHFWTN